MIHDKRQICETEAESNAKAEASRLAKLAIRLAPLSIRQKLTIKSYATGHIQLQLSDCGIVKEFAALFAKADFIGHTLVKVIIWRRTIS